MFAVFHLTVYSRVSTGSLRLVIMQYIRSAFNRPVTDGLLTAINIIGKTKPVTCKNLKDIF